MGNGFGKKKNIVDERHTRPQRLLCEPSNVDYKKLRKLILSSKLAPCYPGAEDSSPDLEECPICFFFYPSLNRSRCCMKGICTECFLQMKPSVASRPAQCPFCKTSSYAVEYRGAQTKEEKGFEQAEEQKVIEAKIRMQFEQEQFREHGEFFPGNQVASTVQVRSPLPSADDLSGSFRGFLNRHGHAHDVQTSETSVVENIEVAGSPTTNTYNNRNDGFDLDLEEIMMVEAIWLSIQKNVTHQSTGPSSTAGLESTTYGSNQIVSLTGGLAHAIARLAEQNLVTSESPQSVCNHDQANQIQDGNHISCQDEDLDEEVGHAREASGDELESEIGCVPSWPSMSEDEISERLSTSLLDGDEGSASGLTEASDIGSYCSSSLHSISDTSCGSPDYSEDSDSPLCSQLSGTITVQRKLVAMPFSIAESHA